MNVQQKFVFLIFLLMSTSLMAAQGNPMVSADTHKLYSDISRNLNVSTKSKLSKISSNIYYKIKKSPRGSNYPTLVKRELTRNFRGLTRQQRDLLTFYIYKKVYDKIESGSSKRARSSIGMKSYKDTNSMMDDAIEEAKSNYEEAKEQFKLALRVLIEHMERQTQVVQKITS